MAEKVKLHRRQIKEDKFTTFMLKSRNRVEENWQYYAIGVVVAALIIAAAIYFVQSRGSSHVEAGQKFAKAQMDYRSGNSQVAVLGLNEIINDYSGDPAAEQALFMLGRVHYDTRNYTEALTALQQYLDKYKDNKLNRAAALGTIAAINENQGNLTEAAMRYTAAIEEYPQGPNVPDYRLGAVRTFVALGDADKARVHADALTKDFAGTEAEKQATMLFAEKGLAR